MIITVVVDANVIMSALLGGKAGLILFDGRFEFTTSDFTLLEVRKYLPCLSEKLKMPEEELELLLDNLPVKNYPRSFYEKKIRLAKKLMNHIDPKDVEILAMALHLETYIWTQDKHFDDCGYEKILKTHQFL